jgi:hypothetical protein
VDSTDGTDGTDGTTETDGGTETDGSDGSESTDNADTVNQITAELVTTLTAPSTHQGALAASGDLIAWCDGTALKTQQSAGASNIETIALDSECVGVAIDGDTPIVVTAAGFWIRDPGSATPTTTEGPPVHRLRLYGDQLYGTLRTSQLAIATADLSKPPELVETGENGIRDIVLVENDWVLALGTGGVKRLSPDGITMGSYLTAPSMANALAISATGHVLVAVAGTGLAVLAPENLAEQSVTKAKGISLDVTVGTGNLSGYALVADWRRAQLIDISVPDDAQPVVREEFRYNTNQSRIISAVATDTGFVGIGLNHVSRLTTSTGAALPQMYLDQRRRKLSISEELGSGAVGIVIFNDGASPLAISNFRADNERMTINEFPEEVGPNNVEFFQVDIAGSEALEGTFSFDTNDPDNATVDFEVQVNPAVLSVGDPAPDFFVPTTDGEYSMLSSYQGSVTYLKFFNAL